MGTLDIVSPITDGMMFSPSGTSTIGALYRDPASVAEGAAAQFQKVGAHVVGDPLGQPILPDGQMLGVYDPFTEASTNMIASTPEVADAWNAGAELALTAEKTAASFFAEAGSALVMEAVAGYEKARGRYCLRLLGNTGTMSCSKCGEAIAKGQYWHCYKCADDNFDLCRACYSKGSRCLSERHIMSQLQ
ncbi:hypothetical protein LY76DRAFT_21799 [Colletotrichum caudatum]|nr:hypothetical protein LY76DRAFT_21799 [Colletotrichum caudatum]